MMRTGVVDEPVVAGEVDHLGINVHSKSLIKFIDRTHTPMTIGIQGEWGSGKTSLMNEIFHFFETERDEVKQIKVNTWEHSLLASPEEALIKIVYQIMDDLITADENIKRKERLRKRAGALFKSALKVGAAFAGKMGEKVADEFLPNSDESIKDIKNDLNGVVHELETRETNKFNKVIVYVDDLDRLDPKHAVAILELLKNIFSIKNCVFVLAIDYQVVVKGLKEKFGKQTAENEWEFRAFFDKIIQLPFMMPMGQYKIGNYVNGLLSEVGFIGDDKFSEEKIGNIVTSSIGGNPRSIKRLINSVSLIQIFTETKSEVQSDGLDDVSKNNARDKLLIFSLLCIQIAYPKIYSLLSREPDFISGWDETFALDITEKVEEKESLFEEDFKIVTSSEYGDEEWERSLYRICYTDQRLRSRFRDIRDILENISLELKIENLSLGAELAKILSQTSVTNVSSNAVVSKNSSKARQPLEGGFSEWCSKRNLNESECKYLDVFIKFISDQGELSPKYTRSNVSFANVGDGKRQNILYLNSRRGGFQIGFAGLSKTEQNSQFFKQIISNFKANNSVLNCEFVENRDFGLAIKAEFGKFTDSDRKILVEAINAYRDKFYL